MDDKKQGYEKEHHSLLTRSEINWTEDKTMQNTQSFLLSSSHWYGCRSDVCCTHHLVWFTLRLFWTKSPPAKEMDICQRIWAIYSNGKRSQIFLRQSTDEQQGAWLHIVHCTRCIWPYTMTLQGGVKKTMKHYQQYVPLRNKWPISCFWQWTGFCKFHELPANQIVKELNILK